MTDLRWLAEHFENGALAFRIGRAGDELVAEWIGMTTLRARRDGTNVRWEDVPGAPADELDKIRRGSGRLLLRQLGGELALHGAAVARGGRAVLVLGRSGQGKSTLAAALCKAGATLYADDAACIERTEAGEWRVLAGETNHWIDGASRVALGLPREWDAKWFSPAPRAAASGAAPIVAIVDLVFADEAETVRLVPRYGFEAASALVPQVARFVLDEPEVQRREVERLAELVEALPVYALVRPRGHAHLGAAVAAVLDLLPHDVREQ